MERGHRLMKTCDTCKVRKVRCSGIPQPGATKCLNCARRNEICQFSVRHLPRKRDVTDFHRVSSAGSDNTAGYDIGGGAQDASRSFVGMTKYDGLQELYVDRLLAAEDNTAAVAAQSPSLQEVGVFGSEYSLTFFPEARLNALAVQLGHDRVSHVRARVTKIIGERMRTIEQVPAPALDSDRIRVFGVEREYIEKCVRSYFEQIDPIHPFIERQSFERIALGSELSEKLASDKSWSALFYAVLALGSQYHDGGSYQPVKTGSWRFFATALAIFPDLLITRTTLNTVQALTAMAIFALNVSCLQIEYTLVSEGARKAQTLGYNRSTAPGDDPRNRTFWVLYYLEKHMSFSIGRSSTIMDSDISSAVPSHMLQWSSVSFDWTQASIRISRLLSRIYASLFSVSVRHRPIAYYTATVRNLKSELEAWAMTIPVEIRPGLPVRTHIRQSSQTTMDMIVRLHYLHYGTALHLDRTALQLEQDPGIRCDVASTIMREAQTILELTKYIDVQPYTPLWILVGTPLAAFLVLFDLVVDNPTHPETAANLAILDVGGGHFSGLEYASQGTLPGSIASELTQIARAYVRGKTEMATTIPTIPSEQSISNIRPSGTTTSDAQPAFDSYADLQSYPFGWDMRGADEALLGTNMLNLFGSNVPLWGEDGTYNI
ncbi:hypothetical protein FB567DRAFT_595699 [Paraphoma chrysanthemicola]|uniref:Zn(2)-C6 fungal-type domain-containing protein n=1 Tax=Paraphoma chrysanthemicola TaxID=798071 RepID=A0A8K0QZA3_9PLEO|nr:hypothetical protein FB567DRAFT_595699 [Paraphoma chrysanthemicola]